MTENRKETQRGRERERERERARSKRRGERNGWRQKRDKDGGGEEMTETNVSALTAVLHFLTDRHTNEDHKSNESL